MIGTPQIRFDMSFLYSEPPRYFIHLIHDVSLLRLEAYQLTLSMDFPVISPSGRCAREDATSTWHAGCGGGSRAKGGREGKR